MSSMSALRAQITALVADQTGASAATMVGRLIDALVAWSRAAGLDHQPPGGSDPVLRFRVSGGGPEVWALYPSKDKGGAKLSLAPGLTDHGVNLRQAARRIDDDNHLPSNLDHHKLDVSLPAVAGRHDWAPIFAALEEAKQHVIGRA